MYIYGFKHKTVLFLNIEYIDSYNTFKIMMTAKIVWNISKPYESNINICAYRTNLVQISQLIHLPDKPLLF